MIESIAWAVILMCTGAALVVGIIVAVFIIGSDQ